MAIWLVNLQQLAATLFLVAGLFFMLVAAVGLYRMPDVYNRMHAATKSVTLGITFMLIALLLAAPLFTDGILGLFAKIVLIVVFQFVANPVGAHMLSKAAHLDGVEQWPGTLDDQLAGENHVRGE